jgi:hypothetical protein
MKHFKIALGLVGVAGLLAVATSPALAVGPRWVTCSKVAENTGKWSNSLCTMTGSGNWETQEIKGTIEVTSSNELEMEDPEASGGPVAIKCGGTNRETIGPEGLDIITRMTLSKCVFVKTGQCEAGQGLTVESLNLPWMARIEERENMLSNKLELRELLRTLASAPPGWKATCRVGGVLEITDECTGNTNAAVRSNRATGATEFVFDSVTEQEPPSCTQGRGSGRLSKQQKWRSADVMGVSSCSRYLRA